MEDASPVVLWRRPAKTGASSPLVLLLHGRGADENDLIDLADRLPRAFVYASLRAPVSVDDGGYTWFENRGVGRPLARSIHASVALIRAWLDRPPVLTGHGRVYLLGFSAGMMMAGALVLDDPQRFAGAVLLSGALPLDSGFCTAQGRLAGLPVFTARGSRDDVIPAALVTQTDSYLQTRSGAALTERSYRHAHSISEREINDIGEWLSERA